MQQSARPEVDVQVEPEPQAQENVPGVFVVGHPRVAHRAEEDRVYIVLEVRERGIGQGFAGLEVVVGAVGQPFPRDGRALGFRRQLDRGNRGLDHLRPDPVSPNDRNSKIPFHRG